MKTVGFKFWYSDGRKYVVAIAGRSREAVQADIDALPEHGLQCAMIYFDQHSNVRCPAGHVLPFAQTESREGEARRICPTCRARIVDRASRFRRMVQGRDFYPVLFDATPPVEHQDWVIGQTDNAQDLPHYPTAKVLYGRLVSDAAYAAYCADAMQDEAVSEFGVAPVVGTMDR